MREELPRGIRYITPGEGFTKLEVKNHDNRPEGLHTGGVYLSPDKSEIWKPLDGGNVWDGPHYATLEAECLEEMAGEPAFPRNWRVEEQNGRRWLVRRRAVVFGQDVALSYLNLQDVLRVERGLKALNAKPRCGS